MEFLLKLLNFSTPKEKEIKEISNPVKCSWWKGHDYEILYIDSFEGTGKYVGKEEITEKYITEKGICKKCGNKEYFGHYRN